MFRFRIGFFYVFISQSFISINISLIKTYLPRNIGEMVHIKYVIKEFNKFSRAHSKTKVSFVCG